MADAETGDENACAPPLPPSSASVGKSGLKDTPANRALSPATTAQATFTRPSITKRAFYASSDTLIFNEDVSEALKFLADQGLEVDCIVTSPPFYGQRDYGIDGQIGLEQHPREFIQKLLDVFELCWPVLRETGSMWVNLGDTYWSGKGAHKSDETKQSARRFGMRPQDHPGDGTWTRPKQLLLIPHRFAIGMQDEGWLIRNDNVWMKPNPIPDQVRDRSSMSKEYVFHFTRARWYYYNRQAVGRVMSSGRVLPPLDVWEVPPARGNGIHKASFSEDLVRIPILATTPPGGVVLDPFAGSGTTLQFAKACGFRSIGIDLSRAYCGHARDAMQSSNQNAADDPVPINRAACRSDPSTAGVESKASIERHRRHHCELAAREGAAAPDGRSQSSLRRP
jgi:site-specific DNA-methyltransferase (cytosine-N4-specific)